MPQGATGTIRTLLPLRPFLILALAAICAPAIAAPSARSVVEAKFAAVNRHAIADVAALYSPDAVITASDFCHPRLGKAGVTHTYENIFKFVPDAAVDVVEYVADGDRVAVKFFVRSRIPGRSFDVPIMDFFTVKAGLIVRDDGIFDNAGRACTD